MKNRARSTKTTMQHNEKTNNRAGLQIKLERNSGNEN